MESYERRMVGPFEPVGHVAGHSFLPLRFGAHVIDLGLYKAWFGHEMHGMYGADVIGCEPHPTLARDLRNESIPWLHLYEVAMTPTSGEQMIPLYDLDVENDLSTTQRPVRGLTFRDFVRSEVTPRWGDGPVDLLKIDIEGAEIALLLDTPDSILQRFQQLTVEFHDFLDATLSAEVTKAKERMRALGFVEFRLTLDNQDVLFVNQKFFQISTLVRMVLIFRCRILRGVSRRIQRRFLSREAEDRVPAPLSGSP